MTCSYPHTFSSSKREKNLIYNVLLKQPHVPISSKFNLFLDQKIISKSDFVKYLGMWIDNTLNRLAHIHAL